MANNNNKATEKKVVTQTTSEALQISDPVKTISHMVKDFTSYTIKLESGQRELIRQTFLAKQFELFNFQLSKVGIEVVNAYDVYDSLSSQIKQQGQKEVAERFGVPNCPERVKPEMSKFTNALIRGAKVQARNELKPIEKTVKSLEISLEKGDLKTFNHICKESFGVQSEFKTVQFKAMQSHHVKTMSKTDNFKPYWLELVRAMVIKQGAFTEKSYNGLYKATIKNTPYLLQSELDAPNGIPTLAVERVAKHYMTATQWNESKSNYIVLCDWVRSKVEVGLIPVYPDVLIDEIEQEQKVIQAQAVKVQADQKKADAQAVKEYTEQHKDDIKAVDTTKQK